MIKRSVDPRLPPRAEVAEAASLRLDQHALFLVGNVHEALDPPIGKVALLLELLLQRGAVGRRAVLRQLQRPRATGQANQSNQNCNSRNTHRGVPQTVGLSR